MKWSLHHILEATGGELIGGSPEVVITGVSTDTRTLQSGELFVALQGPHFDGHDFIAEAIAHGGAALLVSRPLQIESILPIVLVPETTLQALGDLAHAWRRRFDLPCVAITGSNGKSTTKEMAAHLLSDMGPILKTGGNFNNLIGLPLTLFHLSAEHKAMVLELGINAPGEMTRLAQIAAPHVGLITNATAAHLEKLQSVDAVARAKGELFEVIGEKGTIILNEEDPRLRALVQGRKGQIIRFGFQNHCDIRFGHLETEGLDACDVVCFVEGKELRFHLPVSGIHNVMNALAALAIAKALHLDLEQAAARLVDFRPMPMRFEQVQLANGVRLVNDSYNANPESMLAAFRAVGSAKRTGRFLAVLGDMLELGKSSAELHHHLGRQAVECGAKKLFVLGAFADEVIAGARDAGMLNGSAKAFCDVAGIEKELVNDMSAGDVVLVKGSRGMRMERIAEHLKKKVGCG